MSGIEDLCFHTQEHQFNLQEITKDWNRLGQIPKGKEDLEQKFRQIMDGFYKSLKMSVILF